ncbi:hypothetical protein [Paenibacillus sp. NAIST15-1]|uniref:hypothetical protein n=1 Tax=Paenibacillus sp. NAIST15-1 TaxID=1605994 RepID=UPI00086F8F06|nr:hypothetical protein [Paenibacillus sp. NAIST15-1]GAV11934.1 hypothetical protein PBN151_1863 [Paenibacillus sp. NAIST15-1]
MTASKAKKPIYKRWWFWILALIIVAGVFGNTKSDQSVKKTENVQPVAASVDTNKKEPIENKVATPQKQVNTNKNKDNDNKENDVKKEAPPATIGLSPEEFKKAFNNSAKEFKSDLRINKISVEKGELQDTFKYMFTNKLGIVGTVNKNGGKIRDVLLIGNGFGDQESAADIIISMGLIITVTNPEISTEDRGKILKELGLLDEGVDFTTIDNNTVRNGIKYRVKGSEEIGIMFSAGDVNDK